MIYIVLASACYQPADQAEVPGDIELLHELGMLPPSCPLGIVSNWCRVRPGAPST